MIKKGTKLKTDVYITGFGNCNEWDGVIVHKVNKTHFWIKNDYDDYKEDSQFKFDIETMKTVNNYIPGSYRYCKLPKAKK